MEKKKERDSIMCYACNRPCDPSNPIQRNICQLCIEAYDGQLYEKKYVEDPMRLRTDDDDENFPMCDACREHRREVWRDYVCQNCWGLLRTYGYSYGLCQECKGCPNLDVFED